jgi:cytochrome c oxidase subunit 2
MNVVLIFSVLILIAIAIWQITKIFEISQVKKVSTQIADDNDNDWNGKLMFAFLIFIYGITIFSFWSYGDVLLPKAASEHGYDYDNLMWISFAIIFFCSNGNSSIVTLFFL